MSYNNIYEDERDRINVLTHTIIKLCSMPQGFRVHFQIIYFTIRFLVFKWSILFFLYTANCNLITLYDHNWCWYLLKFCQKSTIWGDKHKKAGIIHSNRDVKALQSGFSSTDKRYIQMFRNIHLGTHLSLLAFAFFFKNRCQTICKTRVANSVY